MIAHETETKARNNLLDLIEERIGTPACAQTDPDLWFPEVAVPATQAKALCNECPVMKECQSFAVWHYQMHGIWGGTNPDTRKKIRLQLGITPRPDHRQTLDLWLEHSQSPSSSYQQSEQLPECLEVDEQHHQSEFQE